MSKVRLANLDEIREGEMIERTHGDQQILLARVDGTVYALNDVCTHMGAPLHEGELGKAGPLLVTCPWHEAHFGLCDGRVHQETPWATDTETYPVEVRDGEVWVEVG